MVERLTALGVEVTPRPNGNLYLAPASRIPPDLLELVRQHKRELLDLLRRRTELIDLPWPVGYGGLPAEEVTRAEAHNDRLSVRDPVNRRLNVLMWLCGHFRDRGGVEMTRRMREAYHELRHADPSIKALCGLCEYRAEDGQQ